MTRYSRRREDGVTEYHGSEEALERAADADERRKHALFFAVLGCLAGGVGAYLALKALGGLTWPRWVRFACVIVGAATSAFILGKLADIIMMVLGLLLFAFAASVLIMIIWSAV